MFDTPNGSTRLSRSSLDRGLAALLLVIGSPWAVAQSHPAFERPIDAAKALKPLAIVRVEAPGGNVAHPEYAIDGNPKTDFAFDFPNGGASLLLDAGRPVVLEGVGVTNGQTNLLVWLAEVWVGPDPNHLRPLLHRAINLPHWRGSDSTRVPLIPSVGRYIKVAFRGGGARGQIGEVECLGRENLPERHLMCWSSDLKQDFLDKLDYLDRDLGVTDLWLDYVETAFPQSNHNSGFGIWRESGALGEFRKRGIRYWLAEHEAFTHLVNDPNDLRDEPRWLTTLEQARYLYAQAKELGFRGLVLDAEDYDGITREAANKYKDIADHPDAWCFAEEFGLSGMYYHRGQQFGRILKEVWGGPLLQVYEARLYAGKGDCRAGSYWWLKGIHDAGIDIWIATERTYGAGNGEITSDYPEWARRWFVQMPDYVPQVHTAYPFATRVLPGFAPWITRLGTPNYLPKYLDQQLDMARHCARGYWIYNEGNTRAGDPRDVLNRTFCQKFGVTPEQYIDTFRRHPTCRSTGR